VGDLVVIAPVRLEQKQALCDHLHDLGESPLERDCAAGDPLRARGSSCPLDGPRLYFSDPASRRRRGALHPTRLATLEEGGGDLVALLSTTTICHEPPALRAFLCGHKLSRRNILPAWSNVSVAEVNQRPGCGARRSRGFAWRRRTRIPSVWPMLFRERFVR
jgi:hypothetical protein